MSLTKEQVERFQAIYKKEFGKEISYEEALDGGESLVNLMKIIYKPITKQEYDQLQKRKKGGINN